MGSSVVVKEKLERVEAEVAEVSALEIHSTLKNDQNQNS
jgi:hypothetical protein